MSITSLHADKFLTLKGGTWCCRFCAQQGRVDEPVPASSLHQILI